MGSMKWLKDHVRRPKEAGYAKRVLDAYRLGIKAHGAIRGVKIMTGPDSCLTCQSFANSVYSPDEAPLIPIAGCTHPEGCRCAYTPVMTYESDDASTGSAQSEQE
jgi:hypothetical protein